MKKYKVLKSISGFYLAAILIGGNSRISPFFSSVSLLAEWVDNYPDRLTIIK